MAEQGEDAPYKMIEIEGKGRGLVATKDLKVGDLVFEEKAFLKLPSEATWASYRDALSNLKPDIQSKLMNLSPVGEANLNTLDQCSFLQALMYHVWC